MEFMITSNANPIELLLKTFVSMSVSHFVCIVHAHKDVGDAHYRSGFMLFR